WRIAVFAQSLAEQGRTTVILGWPQAPFMVAVAVLLGIGTAVQAVTTARAAARVRTRAHARTESPIVTPLLLAIAAAAFALAAVVVLDFGLVARWTEGHVGLAVTIAFTFMWLLMLAQVPLAAVMGLTGVVGSALFVGFLPATSAFATEATSFL